MVGLAVQEAKSNAGGKQEKEEPTVTNKEDAEIECQVLSLMDMNLDITDIERNDIEEIKELVIGGTGSTKDEIVKADVVDAEKVLLELKEFKDLDPDWKLELDNVEVLLLTPQLEMDKFEIDINIGTEGGIPHVVTALVDSGAGTNFISSKCAAKMKKYPCKKLKVTGAFAGATEVNELVQLSFRHNGKLFEGSFAVLPNYEKPVILGLPFIQQYHEDLNFKEKTLAGIQSCSSLDLIDANTFLREMNTGQIGMFLVKMDSTSEEADVGGKIGDKDIVDEVQGDNKGVFQELLREYVDIFKNELDEAPPHRGNWDPKIEVIPYATPPASRQYPLSQPEAAELKAQVLKMLKAGLISLSPVQLSNYNAPVLFVKKSDGSFRLCIDFRLLNLTVVQKAFNMPVADLLVREVAGYRYYSTLDMVSAFHQLHLEELSKRYTVFTAFGRRYSFNVLPFGYTNAPAHLSEVVSELVADIDGCTNFVDDIIVYSNSLLEHKEILRKLFEKFRVHHFWFKPAKCFFGNSSATFLGHEVNKAGVTIPDDHLATIRNLVFPPTPKGMRKALGFFNFFRAYVKNYAAVTHVLYKFAAARKATPTDVHRRCFENIRQQLLQAPILKQVDYSLPKVSFQIEVDASSTAIGAVLSQVTKDDKVVGPVAMISRSLTVSESHYSVRQQELLAIVFSLKKWRHIVLGYPILVWTDHQSLSTILSANTRPENSRIIRWLEMILEFNVRIRYRSGEENTLADVLSRMVGQLNIESLELNEEDMEGGDLNLGILLGNEKLISLMKDSYADDPYLTEVIKYLTTDEPVPPEMVQAMKKYRYHDGLLLYKSFATFKPVIGTTAAKDIIRCFHQKGHVGISKIYWAIQPFAFVYKLLPLITEIVNCCDNCQRNKSVSQFMGGLMIPSEVPPDCFTHIHVDFITGLPTTPDGYDAIMVVVDALTKYTVCSPCKKTDGAIEVAQLLMQDVFNVYGVPHRMVSDKDIRFVNLIYQYIMEYYGIEMRTTSTNNPAANGQVEAINKSVVQLLRAYCGLNSAHWSTYLKIVQFTLNTHWSKAIGMTPYQALFGRVARDPVGLSDLRMVHTNADAAALVNRTQLIRTYIKDTLSRYQDDMEKKANKGRKGKKYKLGEWILLHRDAYYTLVKYKKLTPVYYGPFKIVKVINENAYELDLPTMVKKDRVINSRYFRKYLLDEVAFRDVPRPGKESEVRAAEVSAILGLDLENKMLDVTWLGCRPNHCTRVLLDWFNKFVPVHLRRALFENAKTLFSDRIADTPNTDESLV